MTFVLLRLWPLDSGFFFLLRLAFDIKRNHKVEDVGRSIRTLAASFVVPIPGDTKSAAWDES